MLNAVSERVKYIKTQLMLSNNPIYSQEISIMHSEVKEILKNINECRLLLGETDEVVDTVKSSNITYIEPINQYHINIDGIDIYGNLGTVYLKCAKQNAPVRTLPCSKGNECSKMLSGKICKYYHDPKDILGMVECGQIDPLILMQYRLFNRNFLGTSWIHTNKLNPLMRNFGLNPVLDKLLLEAGDIYDDQIALLKAQIMHDILTLRILSS